MSLTPIMFGPLHHVDVPVRQAAIEQLQPHGPDPVVFGAPRPMRTPDEAEAIAYAASRAVYYACCQVRGLGLRCWHCGRHGQIAPEPERIEDAPAATAI